MIVKIVGWSVVGWCMAASAWAQPVSAASGAGATPARPVSAAGGASPMPVLRPTQASGGEPALPHALRVAPTAASPSGAALQALVDRKLRRRFLAADTAGAGRIDQAQARASGWGFVALNFDQIDVRREGRISFEDIERFMRAQRAR